MPAGTAEHTPLLKNKSMNEGGKGDFVADAMNSECAKHIDTLFPDAEKAAVGQLKKEMFEKVYETMGTELEAQDLVRALVVRNEKFGFKLSIFFTVITFGLFLLFRPRDDDTILVLTKDGTIVKMKIERTPCCPRQPNAAFFIFMKYVSLLFAFLVLPNLIYLIVTGKSIEQELHDLHLDTSGYKDIPALLKRNYPVTVFTLALLCFWLCSMMPHDYRDTHRRRHTVREVAVGQFTLTGSSCRRRGGLRLFFGKYPSQLMLDLVGTQDIGKAAGTIPPGDLSALKGLSASSIIVGLTLFLSFVTGVDTFFAWMDRSIALDHFAKMQRFCAETTSRGSCTTMHCEEWVAHSHLGITADFCQAVLWSTDPTECQKYLGNTPCCGGCTHGGYMSSLDEGLLANIKSLVSLIADTGTILFSLLAARFALNLATATDNIDVLIKRRSRRHHETEIANFDFTVPLAMDFMETVFAKARHQGLDVRAQRRNEDASNSAGDEGKWSGIKNFKLDDSLTNWEDFFEDDLLAPPDTRWTCRLKVPRRLLGIHPEEEVLGAWIELPLLPPPVTLFEFMTGGLWYALLPFGKTRHAVIVTDQRLFYVRQRRPSLPLKFLGTNLRIDAFRHDHDVVFGRMDRTKLSFPNRMVHQNLLFERFIPGRILMQTRFGALEICRQHGDALDVYHLVTQLNRNTTSFISKEDIERQGIIWSACQAEVAKSLKNEGSMWSLTPQPDDAVVPVPDFYLSRGAKEQMVFHTTFKDLASQWSGTYVNTDVIVTTGRIFFWSREVYKKFDCQALPCWLVCWMGCLNRFFAARNLPNSMSFFTLPTLLSFSTDLQVDPASWFVPHHTPLKVPCIERLCGMLTRCVTKQQGGTTGSSWSCLPRRSGASANLSLLWRLKQSSHADEDMVILYTIKPHLLHESPDADAEDVFEGLGFVAAESETAAHIIKDHEMKVETLRKLMSVVQDSCNKLSDKVDDLV